MDLSKIKGNINKQVSSYSVELVIPKDDLDKKFDEYWNEVKDVIPISLNNASKKGGFRKPIKTRIIQAAGGKSGFFKPVLMDVVKQYLDTQDRQSIALIDTKILSEQDEYIVNASVYLF